MKDERRKPRGMNGSGGTGPFGEGGRSKRPFRKDDPPAHSFKSGPRRRVGPPPVRGEIEVGPLGPGVRIVHEDVDLIVVDKPPGLLSADATGEGADALLRRVQQYIRMKNPRAAREKSETPKENAAPRQIVGIIHRLDREASGLMVFSLGNRAYTWLKDDFKNKRVHRMYVAVVEGVMGKPGDAGTIQTFLREHEDGQVQIIPMDEYRGPTNAERGFGSMQDSAARLAVTHYRILHTGEGRTMVQLRLATGRKNQIRAHLAHKGFPIIGDRRFGSRTDPIKRVALHASELGFTHPGSGQQQRYSSPAPPGFFAALNMPAPTAAVSAHEQRLRPSLAPSAAEAKDTSWNKVAAWYDDLVDERKNDHYTDLIIPGTLRLVGPHEGMSVLDVACGQGVIARSMASLGANVTGVDAASDLIAAAKQRGGGTFHVGDARELAGMSLGEDFDAATCVMALTNIEPIDPVMEGVAGCLKPGGSFVMVISHPSFRVPKQTAWEWDETSRAPKQYRRVDGYLSPGQHAITMHPGEKPDVVTWTFHRPLQAYVKALSSAGFVIETIEEWASRRVSEQGPRAAEENRARREIPLFMAIRAVKR